MKIRQRFIIPVLLSLISLTSSLTQASDAVAKASFWDIPQKGTNQFNEVPEEQWFAAAAKANIEWVRITFSKWDGKERDFLAGSLDNYQGLVQDDLIYLKKVVGWAEKYNLKVVIAPLGLPGSRWAQNNNRKKDTRLWQDKKWWKQSAQYWKDIAKELKDNNTIVAYNIINEPIPEYGTGLVEHGDPARYLEWYKQHKGTSRDLPDFYNTVIAAIREVDTTTPIMVDSGWYAQAQAFVYWPKLNDNNVLYAFHMYEPFDFTNRTNFLRKKNKKPQYTYPGKIPYAGQLMHWDKAALENWFNPMFEWADKNQIPHSRIVAAEFGSYRMNPGTSRYIGDLLDIFEEKDIHWAFYSYREDEWDGYDYEVGSKPLGWKYWQAMGKRRESSAPYESQKSNLAGD